MGPRSHHARSQRADFSRSLYLPLLDLPAGYNLIHYQKFGVHYKGKPMLNYIYNSLEGFRSEFSRERTWLIFCSVVISFMAAIEMIGVTSMCRFWMESEAVYNSLIHFFRSKAYD